MPPASFPTSLEPLSRPGARAEATMHATLTVPHRGSLTSRCPTGLRAAPGDSRQIPWRVPVFEPTPSPPRARRLRRNVVVAHGVHREKPPRGPGVPPGTTLPTIA